MSKFGRRVDPARIPLRELEYYNIEEGGKHIRHDFAWRDPASGRLRQYCVDSRLDELITETARQSVRETARGLIAGILESQCGVERALANQYQLGIPRATTVRFI